MSKETILFAQLLRQLAAAIEIINPPELPRMMYRSNFAVANACYKIADLIERQEEAEICKNAEIGKEISPVREEVLWFAQQMELKLKANDYKDGWKDCDISWLWARTKEELYEVIDTLKQRRDAETVIKECADVANFAMMIADVCRNKAK